MTTNILFVFGYQTMLSHFEKQGYSASAIYSVFYLFFIPVAHAFTCLLVFGWPATYIPSLLSNVPIGLSAMAIGATATGWLDRIGFDHRADEFINTQMEVFGGVWKNRDAAGTEDVEGKYSSIVVLIITGIWSYVFTVIVMSQPQQPLSTRKDEKADSDEDDKKIV